ncbi:hypothetical protein B0H19DRAFT_1080053 [Mycena capillaripes]|nr:hypothetical protein B0H19DRAFT_1080053 [Mycena capillaripes]
MPTSLDVVPTQRPMPRPGCSSAQPVSEGCIPPEKEYTSDAEIQPTGPAPTTLGTRKIRCITSEQPPRNPCARCTKKRLACEYVAASEPDCYSPCSSSASSSSPRTPDFTGGDIPPSPASTDAWTPLPPSPNLLSHKRRSTVTPQPAPNPIQNLSYYAGTQYPDLALFDPDWATSLPTLPYYPSISLPCNCPDTDYAVYEVQAAHAPQHPAVYPGSRHLNHNRHARPSQYPMLLSMPPFAETNMPNNAFDWQQELSWG